MRASPEGPIGLPKVWDKVERPYHRRSVLDLAGYCGRKVLEDAYHSIAGIDEPAAFTFATLFVTGCRACEAIDLRRYMFEYSKTERGTEFIQAEYVPVLKHRRRGARTFPISLKDPLVPEFQEILKISDYETKHGFIPRGDVYGLLKSYGSMYYRVGKIQRERGDKLGPWYPHRLRHERANQLVVDHKFDVPRLMSWFSWGAGKKPTEYVSMSPQDLIRQILGEEGNNS